MGQNELLPYFLRSQHAYDALCARAVQLGHQRYAHLDFHALQDITQQAAIRFPHDKYGLPDAEATSLFFGIFYNRCADYVRDKLGKKGTRRITVLAGDSLEVLDRPVEGGLAELLHLEATSVIEDALRAVGEPSEPLLRQIGEGISRLSMIEQLGLNKNTYDTRLRTARRRLREQLQRRGVDP